MNNRPPEIGCRFINLAFLLAPLHAINRLFKNLSCDRVSPRTLPQYCRVKGHRLSANSQNARERSPAWSAERKLIQKGGCCDSGMTTSSHSVLGQQFSCRASPKTQQPRSGTRFRYLAIDPCRPAYRTPRFLPRIRNFRRCGPTPMSTPALAQRFLVNLTRLHCSEFTDLPLISQARILASISANCKFNLGQH